MADLSLLRVALDPEATLTHIRVLAAITVSAQAGWSECGVADVMDAARVSRRTALRAIEWLEARGHLLAVRTRRRSGTRSSNRYWVRSTPPTPADLGTVWATPPPCVTGTPNVSSPGQNLLKMTHGPCVTQDDTWWGGEDQAGQQLTQPQPTRMEGEGGVGGGVGGNNGRSATEPSGIGEQHPVNNESNYPDVTGTSYQRPHAAEKNRAAPQRDTWLSPYFDAWVERFGGRPNAARMARALAPVHQQYGIDKLLPGWVAFLNDPETEARYITPEAFASKPLIWTGDRPRHSDRTPALSDEGGHRYVD